MDVGFYSLSLKKSEIYSIHSWNFTSFQGWKQTHRRQMLWFCLDSIFWIIWY
jgi:hypothetical protein